MTNTFSTKDKTPPLPQAPTPAATRGSPIDRKLTRHATQAWATLSISHQAIEVRLPPSFHPTSFGTTPLPPSHFAVPSPPDPTMAHQPPIGGCPCHERGPQHIGILVSACSHGCTQLTPISRRSAGTISPHNSAPIALCNWLPNQTTTHV